MTLTQAELTEELKQVYALFDYDNDGAINKTELPIVLRSVGLNPSESELKNLEKGLDQIGQKATVQQLVQIIGPDPNKYVTNEKDLQDALSIFDKRGDGVISTGDLKHSLTTMAERLKDENIEELIRVVDPNLEGTVPIMDIVKELKRK
ncbi:DgyrCDS10805 [Dimorphilus gyrociliatus]|uniref:DgyrCDS10805 n=1 Tax=Dimorphilus gyrociliatus TaxID=2664684 RepID=A0A7I8W2I0_9ANNE|nr:DgyrCDS10805 [Dimorphilus gyrociliatus]